MSSACVRIRDVSSNESLAFAPQSMRSLPLKIVLNRFQTSISAGMTVIDEPQLHCGVRTCQFITCGARVASITTFQQTVQQWSGSANGQTVWWSAVRDTCR